MVKQLGQMLGYLQQIFQMSQCLGFLPYNILKRIRMSRHKGSSESICPNREHNDNNKYSPFSNEMKHAFDANVHDFVYPTIRGYQ